MDSRHQATAQDRTYALLPTKARWYVAMVVAAGAVTIMESVYQLWSAPIPWDWTILAFLTLISGSATVRLPGASATISISETFVFTSVLLFGPAAGTLTVALDALVISGWSYRKGHPLYKAVFNICALPLSIWLASHAFFIFAGIDPLYGTIEPFEHKSLIVPLLAFTIIYFSLNSWIITIAIALERHIKPFGVWRSHFSWLSVNYFGGASIAWLLVSYTRAVDYTYLLVILPLLVVLYLTYYLSMRRVQDAHHHLTQLNTLYMSTVETLAMAIDAKDQITHGHIRRVQTYAVALAKALGVSDPNLIKAVEAAALLHDMGKLAVPEYILNKPGPLTPTEFDKMKLHASVGADILSAIQFPYPVVPIVRHHHENWNGQGYPDGLAGTDIPIGARILAVVDCYDALTSDRPYRPKLDDQEAMKILHERRGSMYDPLVVDAFARVHNQIEIPSIESTGPYIAITAAASSNPHDYAPIAPTGLEDIAASTGEMLTLFELARSISTPMELSDLCDLIVKHLRRLIPCSLCVFFIYDEDADEICASHVTGEHSGLLTGLRIAMGQRLSGWVAANRHTIRNSDPSLDLGEGARTFQPRHRSCMSTPLTSGTSLVGVITLYSTRPDAFTAEHQRILEVVSTQVSPAIKAATSAQRLRRSHRSPNASTDLPSMDDVKRALGQHDGRALPNPTSVILVGVPLVPPKDRDGFHGALSEVTPSLRQALRAADLLFRVGPHDFGVLLLKTPAETCSAIADRIRTEWDSLVDRSVRRYLLISSATTTEDDVTLETLVESARRRGVRDDGPTGRKAQNSSSSDSIH
jgi:putative nucleotidyltransferase with HDIG domain